MKKIFLLICFLVTNTLISQEKWSLDAETSFVNYEAKHFLHSWEGSNQNVKGLLTKNGSGFDQMALVMSVSDFNSNNSSRDANAAEVLEILSFPDISFTAKEISQEKDALLISGTLQFHGVSIPKTIRTQLTQETPSQIQMSGSFPLNLEDFNIALPSFMLKKMEENILVSYEFNFQPL